MPCKRPFLIVTPHSLVLITPPLCNILFFPGEILVQFTLKINLNFPNCFTLFFIGSVAITERYLQKAVLASRAYKPTNYSFCPKATTKIYVRARVFVRVRRTENEENPPRLRGLPFHRRT